MKRDCILIKEKPRQSIFWSALMLLTLGMGMAIFYEATGERKYWVNRWRLWRALKAGRVRIERDETGSFGIDTWSMWIDDRCYVLSIFRKGKGTIINSDNFTVSECVSNRSGLLIGASMIGLFNGSLITNFLRRSSHRMLLELADPAKVRDRKLQKIGI